MRGKDIVYELDYLYLPETSDEFESVHIALKMAQESIDLLISSAKPVSLSDLNEITKALRNHTFKRMYLSYGQDCIVYLNMCGEQYKVNFDSAGASITDIVKI